MGTRSSDTAHLLLQLPAEIRQIIYRYLLIPRQGETIKICTDSPAKCRVRDKANPHRRRTRFRAILDRVHPGSLETTYSANFRSEIHVAILSVCRQIHGEACHVLYSEHTFEFDLDIESIVPFLQDRTLFALASIRNISIAKRGLPYCRDFDHCEWRNACTFLAERMSLRSLSLRVVGGKPGPARIVSEELEPPKAWTVEDFESIMQSERMEWARQFSDIRGLQTLSITTLLKHCPPPRSEDMAFFTNFSTSIKTGFAPYLERIMVDGEP